MSSTTQAAVRTSSASGRGPGLGREQHQQRPEPLAAGRQQVRGRLGDVRRPALAVPGERLLDARQPLAQPAREGGVDDRQGQAAGAASPDEFSRNGRQVEHRARDDAEDEGRRGAHARWSAAVSTDGWATLGPSPTGSAKYISRMTRT